MRLAILLALLPSLAEAQTVLPCGPHDVMATLLAEGWGETRQDLGLEQGGAMVEVFASDESGTWTLTVTSPARPTCVVLTGRAWEAVEEPERELG